MKQSFLFTALLLSLSNVSSINANVPEQNLKPLDMIITDKVTSKVKSYGLFSLEIPDGWQESVDNELNGNGFILKQIECSDLVCWNMVYTPATSKVEASALDFLSYWKQNFATQNFILTDISVNTVKSNASAIRYDYMYNANSIEIRGVVYIVVIGKSIDVFTFTGSNNSSQVNDYLQCVDRIISSIDYKKQLIR